MSQFIPFNILTSPPESPIEGTVYYDAGFKSLMRFTGDAWAVIPLDVEGIDDLISRGIVINHLAVVAFTVLAGTTRLNPDLIIPDGMLISVEEGGELLVL